MVHTTTDRRWRLFATGLRRIAPLSVFCFLAGACAVGPDYVRPEPPLPAGWQAGPENLATVPGAPVGRWWDAFGDPELSWLVERAALANLDLARALGRVAEAQALYRVTASAQFPSLDSNADVSHERSSVNALFPGGTEATVYGIGVSASWEVDIFGRVRRAVEASGASVEASEDDRRAVLVAVIAEVASTYVDVRTIQRRLDVAHENLESQGKIVELTRIRHEGGIASSLDVAQAESIYANTKTVIPPLESALARSINRLSVLLGENPGGLGAELEPSTPIPPRPSALTVELPVDMVRQRPDIREAERQLATQTALIGVATADLYPRFTLLGSFGFDSTDFAKLFTGPSRSYTVGPAVTWNVFDAGRIRGLIGAEEARTAQALAFYEQSILRGLEEVENALVTYARLEDERAATQEAIKAAYLALDLSTMLYKDGLADFQNVLDAQRTALLFDDRLAVVDGASIQTLVQLYRALGGGWAALEQPPPEQDGQDGEHGDTKQG